MAADVEKWLEAGKRLWKNMDVEDMAALKLCLLSTGALMGLSVTSKIGRKVTGMAAGCLAAGMAIPLASKFLAELEQVKDEEEAVPDFVDEMEADEHLFSEEF